MPSSAAFVVLPLALSLILQILSFPSPPAPFDCSFELFPSNGKGFCTWRPDNEQSALLWHNGNAVLVDAANSLVHSTGGAENRFAYVQGRFGAPTEGSLRSPLVVDRLEMPGELTLSYWKANASPSLDICVEEDEEEPLRCVDTIQGPGQQQWVRRALELPRAQKPFRVVLRARNLLSAEDIIGVDDIRLLSSAQLEGEHSQHHPLSSSVSAGNTAPKNPFDGMEAEMKQEQKQQLRRMGSNKLAKIVAEEQPKERPQQTSPIRPQIRLSPSMSHSSRPFGANDQSLDPPAVPLNTEIPPLDSNLLKMSTEDVLKSDDEGHCRAVSCSFLEGNCLWQLGPGWHNNSEGSLSIQSPVQNSQLTSALFKPALTSSVDFDLWMSDSTELTVVEKQLGREDGGVHFLLFSRQGATEGGWHRFRVPLRPSFSPVRLIFRIKVDGEQRQTLSGTNFVSLSNLKLVNGDGNEIGCETAVDEEEPKTSKMPSNDVIMPFSEPNFPPDDLFGVHQPTPLQLPSQFPLPPPLLMAPPPSLPSPFAPRGPSPPVGPPSTPLFNPLSPMFEGFLPIVPLRGNPPRLTALMDAPVQREQVLHKQIAQTSHHPQLLPPLTTNEKALLAEEEEDDVTPAQHQQPQGLLQFDTKNAEGESVPTLSKETDGSGEMRRHQLKRVIRPESDVGEMPKTPQLVVLPKGRKWERKAAKTRKGTTAEEGEGEGPILEMGARLLFVLIFTLKWTSMDLNSMAAVGNGGEIAMESQMEGPRRKRNKPSGQSNGISRTLYVERKQRGNSLSGGRPAQPTGNIRIPMKPLMEALNMFSGSMTMVQISWNGEGFPLLVILEDEGIVVHTEIRTLTAPEFLDFEFDHNSVVAKAILNAQPIREIMRDLDDSAETVVLTFTPAYLQFYVVGGVGRMKVELPANCDQMELLNCTEDRVQFRYRMSLFKRLKDSIRLCNKLSFRVDSNGILSSQMMVQQNEQNVFIEFYIMSENEHYYENES
uniref:MAM domain-containing protein n=1 Tax=Globodera rostochiensis TaxID=31243 RepID=A0A914GSX3_GLORO